jgi:hypothetical protein
MNILCASSAGNATTAVPQHRRPPAEAAGTAAAERRCRYVSQLAFSYMYSKVLGHDTFD